MRYKAKVSYVFVGLVFAGIITEVMLRLVLGLGNPILIQPDAACSYILKPDQDVRRFFCRTHVNHYGMRSDEVAATHKPGTLRLLFVGDSITYGTTRVDQNEIFSEVLHHELPSIVHRPVEVLNASAGAWAPDNELSYIRTRGIFQSDLVLLVLNDGDLTQPRSTITDIGDNLPRKRPATAIGELYARYIRPRITHSFNQDAGDKIAGNAEEVMRRNLTNLDAFDEFVNSHGARFILVYIPFRKDIPQASNDSANALYSWSRSHHITMFDLTSAEAPHPPNEITFDGIHLNAKGHLIVARAIEKSWPQLGELR